MSRQLFLLFAALIFAVGCQSSGSGEVAESTAGAEPDLAVATFAGGCFWCMQPPFDDLDGVESTVVGYTGGEMEEPVYEEVASGATDHVEAVEIRFDPEEISYEELLHVFWRSIDPTDDGGQFADRGPHYRTYVFAHDDAQFQAAEKSRDELESTGPFDDPIVTQIVDASTFWIAEEYHQKYYEKNPDHYQSYYVGSGRAGFLEAVWGDG